MSSRPACLALVVLACLTARPAAAHPHVIVDTSTVILHDADGQVTGLKHTWVFDEFYSTYATQGLDTDRNGQFSREELAELTRVNLENLGQQSFFTVLRHDRRFVSFGPSQDGWSEMVNGKLVLHFTVPVRTPFRVGQRPLALEVYDPEFFVSFNPGEGEPVRLDRAPAGCGLDVTPPRRADGRSVNLAESFFQALGANANFGQQFATRFTVTCR